MKWVIHANISRIQLWQCHDCKRIETTATTIADEEQTLFCDCGEIKLDIVKAGFQ